MMEHRYYVYIVSSNTGTLYIGATNDIYRRMMEHKSGEFEGFASKYGCSSLVHYECYDQVLRAISREKQLKGWRREKKVALIERDNPRWQDLAEHWVAKWLFRKNYWQKNVKHIASAGSSAILRLGRSPSLRMTPR